VGRPPKSALTHSAVSTRVWIEMGSAQVSMATRLDASLDSREICVILPGHARPSQTGDCSGNCSGCRFRWVCMGEQLSMPRPYFPTTYLSMQVGPTSVLKPFKAWVAGSNPAALTTVWSDCPPAGLLMSGRMSGNAWQNPGVPAWSPQLALLQMCPEAAFARVWWWAQN